MSKVKDGNYIVIQSFMVKDLHLKGNELLIYAIIYGFTQDGEHQFNGGQQYLSDWTNSTKTGVYKAIKKLIEKGLIERVENTINGVNFVSYRLTKLMGAVNKVNEGVVNKVNPIIKEVDNKYIEVKEEWNKLGKPIPEIQSISGQRQTMLNCRINEYGADKVLEAIRNIGKSQFLKGNNKNGWIINFDWFVRPNNFVKVLEGNYIDHLKMSKLKSKPTYDINEIQKQAMFDDNYEEELFG